MGQTLKEILVSVGNKLPVSLDCHLGGGIPSLTLYAT